MSAVRHTAEPWKASGMDVKQDVGPQYGGRFIAFTGPSVRAIESGYPASCEAEDLANAQRAVACVNACAGIADPAELRAQRDELLAALKWALREVNHVDVSLEEYRNGCHAELHPDCPVCAGYQAAKAAITNAEGGRP